MVPYEVEAFSEECLEEDLRLGGVGDYVSSWLEG